MCHRPSRRDLVKAYPFRKNRYLLLGENAVRGEHIDRIRMNLGPLLHHVHGHLGEPCQNVGQTALVRRAEVGDDDDPQPRLGRQPPEEALQGLDTSRRSANANDRERRGKLVQFVHDPDWLASLSAQADEPRDQTLRGMKPEFCALLRNRLGHDFSGYKTRTFLRRVQRRMQVTQLADPDAYLERLRQEPKEVAALFRDLLINVTGFFRDADAFDSLAKLVIPKLFEDRSSEDTVRIWVPGCSTGEEVFSIGMLVREHMVTLAEPPRVQIFATDIDEHALAVARVARYPEAALDGVSPERRQRFFITDGASCVMKHQVIPLFHYALHPGGYLFLGLAENVSSFADLFAPLDKTNRLFRSRTDATPTLRLPLMLSSLRTGSPSDDRSRRMPLGAVALRQATDSQVLDRYAPPHVVVNADGEVIHYSTRTGKYLEAPGGVQTRQITTIVRKGLRLDLRALFREAVETEHSVARSSIAVETDEGNVQLVTVKIEPLVIANTGDQLYLILFIDEGGVLTRGEAHAEPVVADMAAAHAERELRETRDRLQATIEEYETALEELKSSKEELVSVNEEQQSTNEELGARRRSCSQSMKNCIRSTPS
jgi:two-component system CheB/CheR fusion protein